MTKTYLIKVYTKLTDQNDEFKLTYEQALLAMDLTDSEIDKLFS